jgi:hypothetical protein
MLSKHLLVCILVTAESGLVGMIVGMDDHDDKPPESTRHSQKRLTARLAAKAA